VRFVVPSAAGGPTDVMARMISPGLNFRFGHPVPIINRAGGNGTSPIITAEKRWFDLPDVPTTRKQAIRSPRLSRPFLIAGLLHQVPRWRLLPTQPFPLQHGA
jgi:hypothetical protein